MTDATELMDKLDELEEQATETAERIEELAADLGLEPDAEANQNLQTLSLLADLPSKRDIRRYESRVTALETHYDHTGSDPCPCAHCQRQRRREDGSVRPWGRQRVDLADPDEEPWNNGKEIDQ